MKAPQTVNERENNYQEEEAQCSYSQKWNYRFLLEKVLVDHFSPDPKNLFVDPDRVKKISKHASKLSLRQLLLLLRALHEFESCAQ